MSSPNGTLQVEVRIAPPKGRKGSQRRNAGGSKVPDPPRIPRITRLVALAIKFQGMVDRGEVRDYADLARLGYVTRARITQIMNLLNLASDIQEDILLARSNERCERDVRCIVGQPLWYEQRKLWAAESVLPDAVEYSSLSHSARTRQ